MPPASDGTDKVVVACEADRAGNVLNTLASRNQRRTAIGFRIAIENPACGVVILVSWNNQASVEARAEFLDGRRIDLAGLRISAVDERYRQPGTRECGALE